jgi:hypothetical protein
MARAIDVYNITHKRERAYIGVDMCVMSISSGRNSGLLFSLQQGNKKTTMRKKEVNLKGGERNKRKHSDRYEHSFYLGLLYGRIAFSLTYRPAAAPSIYHILLDKGQTTRPRITHRIL